MTGTDRETGSSLLAHSHAGVFRLGCTPIGIGTSVTLHRDFSVRFDFDALA